MSRCRRVPDGYVCPLGEGHNGCCQARPAWWNLAARMRVRDAAPRPLGPADEAPILLVVGVILLLTAAGMAIVGAR